MGWLRCELDGGTRVNNEAQQDSHSLVAGKVAMSLIVQSDYIRSSLFTFLEVIKESFIKLPRVVTWPGEPGPPFIDEERRYYCAGSISERPATVHIFIVQPPKDRLEDKLNFQSVDSVQD